MDALVTYMMLFVIIIAVRLVFRNSTIPSALLLVISGIILSLLPNFPRVALDSNIVLDIFLPMLIYQISVTSSWREFKSTLRPIILLSVGHVLFITLCVAIVVHYFFPNISWPLAFLLGAIVSPPDDIAIVAMAEKINMPKRIMTILKGEGLLNDATALIVFRLALSTVFVHEFSPYLATSSFFMIIIGETLYGICLGHAIGKIRSRINDPLSQILISLSTPFFAYLPAIKLGGSGVLATAVTGLIIEYYYIERFSPEIRLLARSIWAMIALVIESILFLLVGLELPFILDRISSIAVSDLVFYSMVVTLTVIIGRFIWVYPAAYLPRYLFPSIRKRENMPWQNPFVVSWAGMRGGISLAAALAVPALPHMSNGVNPTDLLVFIVFCVIIATLILQGLALPWVIKVIGLRRVGQHEQYLDHISELSARKKMANAVLAWLLEFKEQSQENMHLCRELDFRIKEYKNLKSLLKDSIKNHDENIPHAQEREMKEILFLSDKIVGIKRDILAKLWQENKISHKIKNKLQQELDHRTKQLQGYF